MIAVLASGRLWGSFLLFVQGRLVLKRVFFKDGGRTMIVPAVGDIVQAPKFPKLRSSPRFRVFGIGHDFLHQQNVAWVWVRLFTT